MSCCSAKTIEDKLQPYELRSMYICQIRRLCKKGIFGEAINVFRQVSSRFFLSLFVFIAVDFFCHFKKFLSSFSLILSWSFSQFFQIVERLTRFTSASFVCYFFFFGRKTSFDLAFFEIIYFLWTTWQHITSLTVLNGDSYHLYWTWLF